MLSFFRNKQKKAGVDITSNYIRFVEISSSHGSEHISSYGEVVLDDACVIDGVIRDETALVLHLKEIKSVLTTSRVRVCLPEHAFVKRYRDVLIRAGFTVEKFVSAKDALIASCIPQESETSFLLLQAEYDHANFLMYGSGEAAYYVGDPANHAVITNANRLYIDWYDAHKERVAHTLVVGSRATDTTFLEYIGRETKIAFAPANVLINFDHVNAAVPIITKEDSYKYAVAIGLAMH